MSNLHRFVRGPILTALCLIAAVFGAHVVHAESLLDAAAVDFKILSPEGHLQVGQGGYIIDHQKDAIILHGESHYTDGTYDVEIGKLAPGLSGSLPKLLTFDHLFYSAEGALVRQSHADLNTSSASCMDSAPGGTVTEPETIEFPPDTWAGASILIPIQQFLQNGAGGDLGLHVFNCTSKPGVYSVTVSVVPRSSAWPYAKDGAVQVNVKPHFGWIDVFIAPFVPKLSAWFDPNKGWEFEGVAIARYYRGPQILIVRSARDIPRQEIPLPAGRSEPSDGVPQSQ